METKETLVVMDTTLGKIKIKLYNDTPLHRDNFIKLEIGRASCRERV